MPESRPAARPADVVFAAWRATTDEDKRQPLAEEMIRDAHLIGMRSEQVIRELGEPNPRRMSPEYGQIKYIVGPSHIDDMWLCITLKDGRVESVTLRSD